MYKIEYQLFEICNRGIGVEDQLENKRFFNNNGLLIKLL